MDSALDKQLTDLAFRLAGDDRQLVLTALTKLRAVDEFRIRVKAQIDLL